MKLDKSLGRWTCLYNKQDRWNVCWQLSWHELTSDIDIYVHWHQLTIVDISWQLLTSVDNCSPQLTIVDISWRQLTSVDYCWHKLTIVDISRQLLTSVDNCWHQLTSVDISWQEGIGCRGAAGASSILPPPTICWLEKLRWYWTSGTPNIGHGTPQLAQHKVGKDAMTQRHSVDMVERWRATSMGLFAK